MKEKDFQTKFSRLIKNNPPLKNTAWELKLTKTGRFSFDQVDEHQITALQQALNGFYMKIPDMSAINGFSGRKGFDCFYCKFDEAYIVVIFYKLRKTKFFYLIPIDIFLTIRNNWNKMSIKENELSIINGVIRLPTNNEMVLPARSKGLQREIKRSEV